MGTPAYKRLQILATYFVSNQHTFTLVISKGKTISVSCPTPSGILTWSGKVSSWGEAVAQAETGKQSFDDAKKTLYQNLTDLPSVHQE